MHLHILTLEKWSVVIGNTNTIILPHILRENTFFKVLLIMVLLKEQ